MKRFKFIRSSLVLLFFIYFAFTDNALAYLDPGYGSFFLQTAIAILLSVGFAVKLYWAKIKSFLSLIFQKNKKPKNNG